MKKTQGVQDLVHDALALIPKPYEQDVIEEVALVVEKDAGLRNRYDDLCLALRTWVVNNWIGQYTKAAVHMNSVRQVTAHRSTIIGGYTKLEH